MTPDLLPELRDPESVVDHSPAPLPRPTRPWWPPKRGLLVIGFGVVAVLGFGALGLRIFAPGSRSTSPAVVTASSTLKVTIAPVQTESVTRFLDGAGTVAAQNLLPILPQATGLQIQGVLVDEGDTVQAGQVLAFLDDAVLRSELAAAEADLAAAQAGEQQARTAELGSQATVAEIQAAVEQAKAQLVQAQANLARDERELTRSQNLADEGAISRQALDLQTTTVQTSQEAVRVASAQINSAQARLESARANVAGTKANILSAVARVRRAEAEVQGLETQLAQALVKAPANGIIAERFAQVGDVTDRSGQLFTIIQDGALELQVLIPETQLSQIQTGISVQISSDVNPQTQVTGTVRTIAPLVNSETREATVAIDLPPSSQLRPGMFLQAAIATARVESLTVPAQAVLPQPDGQARVFVLMADDNQVQARAVETGALLPTGEAIEITQGLQSGEQVVVAGAAYLQDGDRVTPVAGS